MKKPSGGNFILNSGVPGDLPGSSFQIQDYFTGWRRNIRAFSISMPGFCGANGSTGTSLRPAFTPPSARSYSPNVAQADYLVIQSPVSRRKYAFTGTTPIC